MSMCQGLRLLPTSFIAINVAKDVNPIMLEEQLMASKPLGYGVRLLRLATTLESGSRKSTYANSRLLVLLHKYNTTRQFTSPHFLGIIFRLA